jgi:hypothetical protein
MDNYIRAVSASELCVANRELDAEVWKALGYRVEWHWCTWDPECGGWEYFDFWEKNYRESVKWGCRVDYYSIPSRERWQPCYWVYQHYHDIVDHQIVELDEGFWELEVVPLVSSAVVDMWKAVRRLWDLGYNFVINRMEMYDGDWVASVMPKWGGEWIAFPAETEHLAVCGVILRTRYGVG